MQNSTKASHSRGQNQDKDSDISSDTIQLTPSEANKLSSRGYRLNKKLGQGYSSKIYLAFYSSSDTTKAETVVACKLVNKRALEKQFTSKFLPREIAILTRISNPHCIQVYHIIEIRSKCFIFMKYAENGDLLEYLTRYGPPREAKIRLWIRQLMLGLKYLQEKCISHRDIKCENILITGNLNVKLADFGFARYWIDEVTQEEVLSTTYCGSVSYAAPEILAGKPYSPKYCDVWSMGVVFFIIVNLSKPFTKEKAGQLIQQQLAKEYQFKPRSSNYISESGKDVIRKMLEPDVRQRITIQEVLDSPWMTDDVHLGQKLPDV